MSNTTPTEFYYHAHGTAVSGAITSPASQVIETTASTAIPIIGGTASASAGNTVISHPQLGDVLSYTSASAQLTGSFNAADGTHNTVNTVTIEGLNILNTITADRIILKLTSKHNPSEREGHIVPLGSTFENLKICGHPVAVEIDFDLFSQCDTYATFNTTYVQDETFRTRVRKQFLWGDYAPDTPQFLQDRFQWHTEQGTPPESKGSEPCTLVKSVTHDQPNVLKTYGNVIIVPQFGTVYLGEVILKDGERSVNMLRIVLGSTPSTGIAPRTVSAAEMEGTIVIGGGGNNGNAWP